MKDFFIILGVFIVMTSAQLQRNPYDALTKVAKECADEAIRRQNLSPFNFSIDPTDFTLNINEPSPKFDAENNKCFYTCLLKGLNILIDGKINVDKRLEFMKIVKPEINDDKKQKIIECCNKANELNNEYEVSASAQACIADIMKST